MMVVGGFQGEVGQGAVNAVMAAEGRIIAVQENSILSGRGRELIIVERAGRVKVEGEDETGPFKNQNLVIVVLPQLAHVGCDQQVTASGQGDHFAIKGGQEAVLQVGVVEQMPLAAGKMIGPVVALARKVDPLGMAELVAHEIQVAVAGGGQGDQADHFV